MAPQHIRTLKKNGVSISIVLTKECFRSYILIDQKRNDPKKKRKSKHEMKK